MAQQLLYLIFLFPLLLLVLLRRRRFASSRPGNKSGDVGGPCRRRSHDDDNRRLPPSPPGELPIIGHLHLVGSHPHVSLRAIADMHGADGVVLLRLGEVPNLVVCSPSAAEAVLRAHDHSMASRPHSVVADILLSGSSDVAMAPYGEYWRQARKLVTAHLLSASKVRSLRRAREEEVRLVLAKVGEAAAARAAVDVTELLGAFVNDVVCRAVSGRLSAISAGHQLEGRRRNSRMLRELVEGNAALLGGFTLFDHFPSLAKVGALTRMLCARATRQKKRWDVLLDEIIDQHVAPSRSSSVAEEEGDFVDDVLSLQQEYCLSREQVKAILMDMYAAGTDTSSIVLEYAMVELIRNPQVMSRLQAEITNNTPKGQKMVKDEDLMNNMAYLKAVVKETLRLHPPAPLLLPRITMEHCDVNGYTIPAGTRVIVNAWALGRDPRSWDKADEFMPERFLHHSSCGTNNTSVDYFKAGREFKFLPFGAGRRVCPGVNFGMATVEIMLANLVYCFGWDLPAGINEQDIDMTEVFGLTVRRKEKLLLVPKNNNHG